VLCPSGGADPVGGGPAAILDGFASETMVPVFSEMPRRKIEIVDEMRFAIYEN